MKKLQLLIFSMIFFFCSCEKSGNNNSTPVNKPNDTDSVVVPKPINDTTVYIGTHHFLSFVCSSDNITYTDTMTTVKYTDSLIFLWNNYNYDDSCLRCFRAI